MEPQARTKKEIAEQQAANARAHQAAEAGALLVLTRARRSAVLRGEGDPAQTSVLLHTSVRDAVVIARQAAGAKGVARFQAEAKSLGVELPKAPGVHADFAVDWQRADRVGKSYSDRWLKSAGELESPEAASVATQGSLERIAVTESSEAFTLGREAAAQTASGTELMKVWDASLDRRTCPTCEEADGTMVGINEEFPAGSPGGVHAYCRCSWTLITVTEGRKL